MGGCKYGYGVLVIHTLKSRIIRAELPEKTIYTLIRLLLKYCLFLLSVHTHCLVRTEYAIEAFSNVGSQESLKLLHVKTMHWEVAILL